MKKRSRKLKEVQANVIQLDFFGMFARSISAIKEKVAAEQAKPKKKFDLSQYNLVYKRKTDGRKFLVKAITKMNYSVIDTVTGKEEKMTQAILRARLKPVKEINKLNKQKLYYLPYGKRKKAS